MRNLWDSMELSNVKARSNVALKTRLSVGFAKRNWRIAGGGTGLGGEAVWSLSARAQLPAMPVVGHLSTRWPGDDAYLLAAFRSGLSEAGFVEGRNVMIEFRWGEGQNVDCRQRRPIWFAAT